MTDTAASTATSETPSPPTEEAASSPKKQSTFADCFAAMAKFFYENKEKNRLKFWFYGDSPLKHNVPETGEAWGFGHDVLDKAILPVRNTSALEMEANRCAKKNEIDVDVRGAVEEMRKELGFAMAFTSRIIDPEQRQEAQKVVQNLKDIIYTAYDYSNEYNYGQATKPPASMLQEDVEAFEKAIEKARNREASNLIATMGSSSMAL